jgi:hypothetical protein
MCCEAAGNTTVIGPGSKPLASAGRAGRPRPDRSLFGSDPRGHAPRIIPPLPVAGGSAPGRPAGH